MKNAFEYTASGQRMQDAKCDEVVWELRWPDGVKCPAGSGHMNGLGNKCSILRSKPFRTYREMTVAVIFEALEK